MKKIDAFTLSQRLDSAGAKLRAWHSREALRRKQVADLDDLRPGLRDERRRALLAGWDSELRELREAADKLVADVAADSSSHSPARVRANIRRAKLSSSPSWALYLQREAERLPDAELAARANAAASEHDDGTLEVLLGEARARLLKAPGEPGLTRVLALEATTELPDSVRAWHQNADAAKKLAFWVEGEQRRVNGEGYSVLREDLPPGALDGTDGRVWRQLREAGVANIVDSVDEGHPSARIHRIHEGSSPLKRGEPAGTEPPLPPAA